jgi:hypothetical protein
MWGAHCAVLHATPAVALQPSAIQAAYIMVRLCVLLIGVTPWLARWQVLQVLD